MILPAKHLGADRAILGVGAEILKYLDRPSTVSGLWHRVRTNRQAVEGWPLSFDWFVLALDFLYASGAVEYEAGKISASERA